jgi:hypothetical protein
MVIFQNFFFNFWQLFLKRIEILDRILLKKKNPPKKKKKKKPKQTLLPSTEKIKSVYHQGKKKSLHNTDKRKVLKKPKKKLLNLTKILAFNNSTRSSDD